MSRTRNSIDNMMKGVIKNTPLETSKKKLTNHTARKTVVKKLPAASVERLSIIQVTGHASEKSLNVYDEGSEKEQQQLSNIISMTPQSAASSSSPYQPIWSFPPMTLTSEQVNTSGHTAFTVNNLTAKSHLTWFRSNAAHQSLESLRPIEIEELKSDLRTENRFVTSNN